MDALATSFKFPDFPLEGKIVLVTGGASGLGLAFSKIALSKGARLLICDPQLRRFRKTRGDLFLGPVVYFPFRIFEYSWKGELIRALITGKVVYQKCDVAQWADLEAAIAGAKAAFGDVPDVYVPGAGVFEPPFSNFWDDPEPASANGYATLDINVNHPIKLTRLAIRASLSATSSTSPSELEHTAGNLNDVRGKRAVVLLVSSTNARRGIYIAPIYSAGKAAIMNFGRCMAPAAALQNVKIVVICPGITATPGITKNADIMHRLVDDDASLLMTPEHVAERMVALVERAEYQAGTVMEVTPLATRVIPEFSDPADAPAERSVTAEDVRRALKPVLEVTAKERGKVL